MVERSELTDFDFSMPPMKTPCRRAAAILLSLLSPLLADPLESNFVDPPQDSQALTWWHWMNGNVSKEGITRDLEAMREVGIQGAILFNIGMLPEGPVAFGGEAWWECVDHALRECDRLGLKFGAFNSDGWSMSGGPWIPVEDSMKQLVWEELEIEGGKEVRLPMPPREAAGSGEVALLAFPALPNERPHPVEEVRGVEGGGRWIDGDESTAAELEPLADLSGPGGTTFDFGKPVTLRRIVFAAVEATPWFEAEVRVEVSRDGERFEPVPASVPLNLKYDSDVKTCTLGFPAVEARQVRVRLWQASADEPTPVPMKPEPVKIGEVRFFEAPRVSFWEAKSGQSKRIRHDRQGRFIDELARRTNDGPEPEWTVRRSEIVDLSDRVEADGEVVWTAPPGRWTVLRVGYASTLRRNSPATAAGKGYECDKMSVAATERHFRGYLGPLIERSRRVTGRPLDFAQMESWEAGIQNWTEDFAEAFEAKRGYDLIPFLPVLTGGRVVESFDVSNRVLWDMRRTVGELMSERYWGTMLRLCREQGVEVLGEGSGMQHYLYDPMLYHRQTDVPMGEFWASEEHPRADCKHAAAVALGYGRRLAAAEAFTAGGPDLWRESPRDLKRMGDEAFALGVNQFVLHSFVHQPFEAAPGLTLGRFGHHFQRLNPWFSEARGWLDYVARCQWLLRQGTQVADLAWFTGEGVPSYLGRPEEMRPALPPGFDYGGVNLELLRQVEVKDGRCHLPSGASHAVLVFPESERMTPELVAELKRLVEAGATVVARRPSESPSLAGHPQADEEVSRAVREWWGKPHAGGIHHGALEPVLGGLGLGPDVRTEPAEALGSLRFIHRRAGTDEIYFLANVTDEPLTCEVTFRDGGPVVEIWDPRDGSIAKGGEGRTLKLALEAHGSRFVIFRQSASAAAKAPPAFGDREIEIAGPWEASFRPIAGREFRREGLALGDLSAAEDPELRFFSGVAEYRTEFTFEGKGPAWLDLGAVHDVATIFLNGRRLGNLWMRPYRLEVSSALKPGRNELRVRLATTAANALVGDAGKSGKTEWPPSAAGRTFVSHDPFTADSPLDRAGLVGPVRLLTAGQ